MKHQRLLRRFPTIIACLLLLTLIWVLLPTTPILAAPRSHQSHPINLQAIRNVLKHQIHVTHTGHVHKASITPIHRSTNTQPAYNNIAISDDQHPATGNFDTQGSSYSAQNLQDLGLTPGLNITANNITYTWPNVPSGTADNYQAAGQVLTVPAISDAANIGFLGASTNGNSSGTATLTFSDGTTQTFSLGLTDWTLGATPSFGNTIVESAMPARNTSINQQTISTYLFTDLQAIPAGKTLQSVTLPTSVSGGQLHIFAIGLGGPAYNNVATSDDSSTTKANIDTQGNSYSAQALQSVGISSGEQIASDDMAYTWPTANSSTANNYQVNGQILPVTSVANATTLGFLGTATNGASSGGATLNFTDGTTQPFTLGFADWTVSSTSALPYGNAVVASMTYRNTKAGKQTTNTYLFTTEVAIPQNETLQSVTLPTTVSGGQMHVFALSTGSALNNVGSSFDSATGSGNYDNQHSSFSVQALEGAGVTPGQPFLFDGVSFVWPQSDGVTGDNYQADGQTIPVTPVNNATTLAFIGSATNGNSSGSITLTYTDGSTQPFTLGLTDWSIGTPQYGNKIAVTMPYRNTVSGQQTSSYYLYDAEISLQASKTLQSVTLPTTLSGGQLHIFAIGTRPAYNNIGLSDDNNTQGADFDGGGFSYSAQDFQDPNGPGWNPGDTITDNGINFIWPNVPTGISDNYQATGQTIPVTPVSNATTIGFVGSASDGGTSGQATLTYTDGTTTTFTLGMSDWTLAGGQKAPSFGNQLFAILPHRNSVQGQQELFTYLFYAETALNTSKTLKSITLPSATSPGQLHIFTIGTRSGTDFTNDVGTSDDNNTTFANYDGGNNSYSSQALANDHLVAGQPFLFNGASFNWPASDSVIPDNYQAAGQTIPVTAVPNATTLAFLGSATDGPSSGTATITYTDGTLQTFTLGFADWNVSSTSSLPFGNSVAASMSYRNTASGQQSIATSLFETEVSLKASKSIQSVTLPTSVNQGLLHVFAIGTRTDTYNNASTSNDTQPFFANFDGGGNSYSQQALQNTGLTPGQTTTINGVSFTWPNQTAGLYDNYQTAGQVIPVTTVSNATTLAFLGSSTNGPSSGTATITYTDGSKQTFSLGLADWNSSSLSSLPAGNSVAATTSYRNTPSGKQTINTYIFYTSIAITSGKTVQSVTLPTSVNQGHLHIFTVGLK